MPRPRISLEYPTLPQDNTTVAKVKYIPTQYYHPTVRQYNPNQRHRTLKGAVRSKLADTRRSLETIGNKAHHVVSKAITKTNRTVGKAVVKGIKKADNSIAGKVVRNIVAPFGFLAIDAADKNITRPIAKTINKVAGKEVIKPITWDINNALTKQQQNVLDSVVSVMAKRNPTINHFSLAGEDYDPNYRGQHYASGAMSASPEAGLSHIIGGATIDVDRDHNIYTVHDTYDFNPDYTPTFKLSTDPKELILGNAYKVIRTAANYLNSSEADTTDTFKPKFKGMRQLKTVK